MRQRPEPLRAAITNFAGTVDRSSGCFFVDRQRLLSNYSASNLTRHRVTTILCDFNKRIMVADSAISDGDRVWSGKKVWRIGGNLLGFAGDVAEAHAMVAWIKQGGKGNPPPFKNSMALLMNADGLFYYAATKYGIPVDGGIEAIGSGAKAAICAYEAMGYTDPKKSVQIVCKHDHNSRLPVRSYTLKG